MIRYVGMTRYFGMAAIFLFAALIGIFAFPAIANGAEDNHASYLVDETGTLTMMDVSAMDEATDFTSFSGTLKAGFTDAVYWVRLAPDFFELEDTDGERADYLIVLNMLLQNASIYLPTQDGKDSYQVVDMGYDSRNTSTVQQFICPVFAVDTAGSDQPVYLKMSSPNTLNTSLMAMSKEDYQTYNQMFVLALGLLFGILLALFFYNLIAFVKLRNAFYLYFVIYILIIMLYQSAYTGTVQLFHGTMPNLLQEHITLLGLMTTGGMVIFARSFMDVKNNVPMIDRMLKATLWVMVMSAILHLFGFGQMAIFATIGIAYGSGLLLIAAAVVCIRNHYWQAKYFLAAWILVSVSLIIFSFRGSGIIPNNALTTLSPMFFAALEFLLLTIAMAERLRLLQIDVAINKQRLQLAHESVKSAELAFLHAQIKPHFLFNTMNSIATLCLVQPADAKKLIMDLALYLQHIYSFNNLTGRISLESEINFIQAYLRIQKVRFGEQLKVHFELDEIKGAWLPPLVIEPLVENAIRHGIRKTSKPGRVTVRVERIDRGIYLEVSDDGIGIPEELLQGILERPKSDEKGIGLANIDMRLKLIYGTGLAIESKEGCGTTVSFTIPWHERMEDESNLD